MVVKRGIEALGRKVISFLKTLGGVAKLLGETLYFLVTSSLKSKEVLEQMVQIGFNSLPVATITAIFTGMVLAVQAFYQFRKLSAEIYVGTIVSLSMTRELGPVLTGLMIAGRVGSAMAAELGTMKVTEQIDALHTLAINPVRYLVVPRFVAAAIMLPILTIYANLIGILGGYLISVYILKLHAPTYIERALNVLVLGDIYSGLIKAMFFGMIIATIGCYKGFKATWGASGVGRATTEAVVVSCMLILIADYFLTIIMF